MVLGLGLGLGLGSGLGLGLGLGVGLGLGLGLGLGFGLPEHRGVARREACGRAFGPGRVRIEGLEVSGLVKC